MNIYTVKHSRFNFEGLLSTLTLEFSHTNYTITHTMVSMFSQLKPLLHWRFGRILLSEGLYAALQLKNSVISQLEWLIQLCHVRTQSLSDTYTYRKSQYLPQVNASPLSNSSRHSSLSRFTRLTVPFTIGKSSGWLSVKTLQYCRVEFPKGLR